MRPALASLFVVAVALGCSDSEAPEAPVPDGGNGLDAGQDAALDGGQDAGQDGGQDGAVDADAGPLCPAPTATTSVSDDPLLELVVSNNPGSTTIADPSIYYPPAAPGGALAYSAVPNIGGVPDQGGLHTRVAVSNDAGASWTYAGSANSATAVAPPSGLCPQGSTCTATVVNETPTILYDAADPDAQRRWKLYTHRYHVMKVSGQPNAVLLYTVGNISQFTAPLPAGPWSGAQVALGWPGSPFSSTGAAFLSTDHPETSGCGAFGEPGATVAPDGSIQLAVSCIRPPFSDPVLDIVLFRSSDHGATWSYVSTPLRGSEGSCFGGNGKRFNAAHLFVLDSTEYLMATPEGVDTRLGCVVIPFANSVTGELVRSSAGRVMPSRYLVPQFAATNLAKYAGACTYGQGATATGYTMSHLEIKTAALPVLHEVATGIVAP